MMRMIFLTKCELIKECKDYPLELRNQIVINYHNIITRSNDYSINESWKICE